ncbi:hypothetical protein EDD11_005160 [Mortierella claussenii]|nr:hypothetical protein EDD11_005160 [Mortierella claussenii]
MSSASQQANANRPLSSPSTTPCPPPASFTPSFSKRRASSSASWDAPISKEARLGQSVAGSSGRSSGAWGSPRPGSCNKPAHHFSETQVQWLVTQLQDPDIYVPLLRQSDGITRQTPKLKIYEKLAAKFNRRFVGANIDLMQIKNKLSNMRRQFRAADSKWHSYESGSMDLRISKKVVTDAFPYYFELEEAWTDNQRLAPMQDTDSVSNLHEPSMARNGGQDQLQDDEQSQDYGMSDEFQEEKQEEEEEEEEEEQDELEETLVRQSWREPEQETQQNTQPSTSQEPKKVEQKDLTGQIAKLCDMARSIVELHQTTTQVEATTSGSLAMQKLELDKVEKEYAYQIKIKEIEAQRAIRIAEILAARDVAIRREELKAASERVLEQDATQTHGEGTSCTCKKQTKPDIRASVGIAASVRPEAGAESEASRTQRQVGLN